MAALKFDSLYFTSFSRTKKTRNDHYGIKLHSINTSAKSDNKPSKKSVHFADAMGLALTSVLEFANERRSSRQASSSCEVISLENHSGPTKLLNFKSPVSSADCLGSLCSQNVCLDSVVCHEYGVYGRVQVRNLAFEKEVFVRYTLDSWQTFEDKHAKYSGVSSVTNCADTFVFHIKVPRVTEDKKLQFAVCYRTGESEFWDNNFGDNFRLVYFPSNVDKLDLRKKFKQQISLD